MRSINFFLLLILFASSRSYGQEEKMLELSSGIRLAYIETGDANLPATILIHGFTDSWKSFDPAIPLFPEEEHVIAITLRGHGNSSKPADGYDISTFAGDIAEFIRIKKLRDVMVAGHSMGGLVAQCLAIDYPELVTSLVIIASESDFANNPGMSDFENSINCLGDRVPEEFVRDFQVSTIYAPVDSLFVEQCIEESMKVPADVWKKSFAGIMQFNSTDEIGNLQIPVMILYGKNDSVIPVADVEAFATGFSKSILVPYTATGHAIHWEFPKEFVYDIAFFRKEIEQERFLR